MEPSEPDLEGDEVLFVARVLRGDPPVGEPVLAATVSPEGDGLFIRLTAGEMIGVRKTFDAICNWGRAIGARRIRAAGRKGWDRATPLKCIETSDDGLALYELELN